ncbi:MAG: alpha-L-rhamnosidase N-terminal domain-containing protein [Chloroflexi bacterium]|nr:alpha-L-rhamnosidase N-terminal domain-containing protein [Chloroflexota bacterium]
MKTILLLMVGLLPAIAMASAEGAPVFETARWIAPPIQTNRAALPIFRKEFLVAARPAHATLRVVGLGDYDALINGRRVAETGINQPWSQYEKTLYYRDFDVASLLTPGANCVGVMLANSFWNNPNPPAGRYNKDGPQRAADEPFRLCAELIVGASDGAIQRIGTDATWRATEGPVTFSHIFAGEDFDARRRIPGWDRAGFDDRSWLPARELSPPAGELVRQFWPAFKPLDRFAPVSVKESAPGVFLYSFAQNCSAQLWLELAGGRAGDRVSFRCGEHKSDKDRLFGGYVVGCDVLTDGRPIQHQWMSFYLGMQFVEVTGAVPEGHPNPNQLPVLKNLELVHVRTALPEVGTFHCSSELYNRTHRLIDGAMRSNMSHVLTDCPHREKLGWLECAYLLAPSFAYRYDCRQWFAKIARDIRDAQKPNGQVLTVAPSYPAGRFGGGFDYTIEWGAAAVLLPWHHYQWYADPAILRDNFDGMKRFTDFISAQAKEGIPPGGLGDWYDYGHGQPPGPSRFTPTDLSATATWALCALTVSRAAEALGRPDAAVQYRTLHAKIAADFQRRFVDPATRKLRSTGSPQCANALAWCAEVVPATERPALVEEIIADLQQRDWQQTPGDVGHVYFIRALAEAGHSDVLHRVYSRQDKGSYGGILSKGLTSLPETWDAVMDGYQSLNHCMLGHVMEWFYGYVAGLRQAAGSVGWQRILFAPCPGSLTSAEATLQTPRGRVAGRWRNDGAKFRLEAEVPDGVEAQAVMPSGKTHRLSNGLNVREEPVKPSKNLPLPGEVFLLEGRTAFLILPADRNAAKATPWVWYAPTLPGLPGAEEKWLFQQFVEAAMAVAGIDVGESYGSPDGRSLFSAFYNELVQNRRFSRKPCLWARSRGGLMHYNWAVEHPESVACIAGIYPVCDLASYPGINKACGAYGLTEQQLADELAKHNPITRVEPLAKAQVPIFHIHGNADAVVPLEKNSAELARRYRQFGGEMTLTVMDGRGHDMWPGWFQCQELVDFVIAHAKEE